MGWSIAVDFVSVHKTQQKEFDQNPGSFLAKQACPTERINISFLSSVGIETPKLSISFIT